MMFRKIRIVVLPLILAAVPQSACLATSRVTVAVYPISGDACAVARDYNGRSAR